MLNKFSLFSICMITCISMFTASSSWATITCTGYIGQSGASNSATIAVASNFVSAMTQLVTDFTNEHSDMKVQICSDSTANLVTALGDDYTSHNNSFVTYSYFFAADNSASSFNNYNGTGTAYQYAVGIPVFFARHSVLNDVNYLINEKSGHAANISDSTLSSYSINTSAAQSIAVAGTGAPYGVMSHTIINQIEGTSLPGTIPSYVHSPMYVNIGNTYDSVINGTNKSGFVSKGQICSGLGDNPDYIYVAFTHPNFALNQYAILLNSNTAAVALNTYIQNMRSGSDWADFLDSNCYENP